MKIAYFDCFSGAGGDMITAAMLDAGLESDFLVAELKNLGVENLDAVIKPVMRSGIAALSFKPMAPEQHAHRNLADITRMIKKSGISEKAGRDAVEIFKILADAEAAVHGKEPDQIHFHEVGAVDSIVDIVAACIGIDALEIDKVICSQLSVGAGVINIDHGIMPAPAPATVEILKKIKAPVTGGPVYAELLTPTAAAILAYYADDFTAMPPMVIDSIGYGAGTKEFKELPNVLRVIIGKDAGRGDAEKDSVCLIEANVDDSCGETVGYFMEKLLILGILDVYITAIQMKKNRPAFKVSVICSHSKSVEVENAFFNEGITLGIRKQVIERAVLKRKKLTVSTKYGKIKIKTSGSDAEIFNVKPEFADCEKAAKQHGISVKKVRQEALREYFMLGAE